jgi:hypothetical protein
MKRRKVAIKYTKERVVLSDVLPFEIPITFSNRHFYNFLVKNKVCIRNDNIKWETNEPVISDILKLLFGIKNTPTCVNEIYSADVKKDKRKIPFCYKISHKENDFRELTIIHPQNQLALIEFYDKYRENMLYYSSISNYSIRKADKIAKYIYQKPKKKRVEFGKTISDSSEHIDKTSYESLKHYFQYKNYSNIHKFYESYQYHQSEKKYNKLFKFDISKCFDSIYTHSITWALLNKEIVKENLKQSDKTFPAQFDELMRNLNYGETNGIIIGPEFSRVFAELILQQIDRNVYLKLKEKKIFHRKDYEVYRYVDDFFVFYNDDSTKELVLSMYKLELKEFKLYLNDSKSKLYEKPIITELSIAKQRIGDLLSKDLKFKVVEDTKAIEINENLDDEDGDKLQKESKYNIYVSSNKLITRFKIIVKETGIDYKDILNYVLASVDKKVEKLISIYDESENSVKKQKTYSEAFLQLLDFTFFLYSVSPRVNSTIKLCMIINKITSFLNRKNISKTPTFSFDNKHKVFKKISDEITQVLNKNKSSEHIQVETLYLLVALGELGREYRIDIELLRKYFNINESYEIEKLNYFSITVLLFYIKDSKRYEKLRLALSKYILTIFKTEGSISMEKKAELVFLLFDVLTCPYLEDVSKTIKDERYAFKKSILSLLKVESAKHIAIIEKENFWFTKWTNFNFGKELESKKSQEVYG